MTQTHFSKKLLAWHKKNQRYLPWKETNDPYKIWLSEIILQQTRVDQGLPYYLKFVKAFPTAQKLASAKEDEVLKLWQGLGYYSRARNLHNSAKYIVNKLNGEFPKNYNEWIQLKGIGPYSAAAISSFAYNEPHAVVDGNVIRLLSRVFGIKHDPSSTMGKKKFQELANKLMSKKSAGKYNQAIMDFGSTICKPQNPKCDLCTFSKNCFALINDQISEFPVKKKKSSKRNRYFNFLYFEINDSTFIEKRKDDDVWKGLYQFPCIETKKPITNKSVTQHLKEWHANEPKILNKRSLKHVLTHQLLHCRFFHIQLKSISAQPTWKKINCQKLQKFAVPRVIDRYLKELELVSD